MKKWFCLLLVLSFCGGCASTQLQAPCDNSGVHCWPRTKINQWNN